MAVPTTVANPCKTKYVRHENLENFLEKVFPGLFTAKITSSSAVPFSKLAEMSSEDKPTF